MTLRSRVFIRGVAAHIAMLMLWCGLAVPVQAATQDGALRMEVITAYNFVVDSNIESPAGKSPSAAHLGVRIYNNGTTPLTNVVVNIGDLLDANTSAGTPGTFESRMVDVSGQYSGTFSLQMPGGAADAVRVIPRIDPGQYVAQYFFVTYPLKDGSGNSVTGATNVTSDDLWLNYDIWAHAHDGATTRRVEKTNKVTMRNEISAMANKIWPNTNSKVPNEYLEAIEQALGWRPNNSSPRIPGANVMEGIWYDLGNIGAGFDNNGDGIPDRNAWLQPVGDPTVFSPLAARLVKCYGIVVVKKNDGIELLIPFEDNLYFENMPENNTGAVGLVYYEFLPLNASLPNRLTPYQEVASGNDNEKFNADFGGVVGSAVTAPTVAQIVKTGPETRATGQNADYVLTATNTGTVSFGWPDLGLPVVIEDVIPTGLHYVAGSAVLGPNVTSPVGGLFTVHYSTDNGNTWTTSEPETASSVNRLRWVLDRSLAPGDTATARFSALVPAGFTAFTFTNTGILKSGTETEMDRDVWTTVRTGINSVGDLVWRDLDRDGAADGGLEIGIPNMEVSLYVDANGNGLLDTGEILYATQTTNGSGGYLFSNLPDAKYVVVIDKLDTDIPLGFTLKSTTPDRYAVDLDSAGSNSNPVAFLTADWPLIEAIELNKTVSPTVYNEGDLITYTIDVENHLNTVAPPQPPLQTKWITSATQSGAGSALVGNVTGLPNNSYGYMDWNSSADNVTSGVGAIGAFPATTGTISKVELLVRGYMSQALVNDRLSIRVTTDGSAPAVNNPQTAPFLISNASLNQSLGAPQTFVIEVTSHNVSWSWTQVAALRASLIAFKDGSGDNGDFYIDSIGVRVTASGSSSGTYGANTLNPLPLTDVYNPSQLQFVSASITPDSTTPPGSLQWWNVGPLNAGARKTVTVTFRALAPTDTTLPTPDGRRDAMTVVNTASTANSYFVSGLPGGVDQSAVNVTVNPAGSIGDFVYWDVNGNGAYNVGTDIPLPGVSVQLWQRTGASTYAFTGIAGITDASGAYLITGLADVTAANAYQVRIVTNSTNELFTLPFSTFTTTQLPSGGSTSAFTGYVVGPDIVLNNTDTVTTNDSNVVQDFGFDSNNASLISGKLFRDWNGNGVQDAGDEPLVGSTVTLSGGASGTALTDANGFYQFTNITTINDHTVTVALPPPNHTQTLDPDGTLNSATTISVASGNAYTNRNFAYRPTGSLTIGDTLYYDWNSNGSQNAGEGGIANVPVAVYEDANADGTINAEDALIATVTTDASGIYQFTGLATGNYIVRVDVDSPNFPVSYLQTQDFDSLMDDHAKINLTTSLSTVDFGYKPIGSGRMGNLVWLDRNNDGLKDPLEPGIDNVLIQLYRADQTPGVDTPYLTTTTSGGGLYAFNNLPVGSYRLYVPASNFGSGQALQNTPWSSVITSNGDDQINNDDNGMQSGVAAAVVSPLIAIGDAENEMSIDFGFTGTGRAGDMVFYDINGNGTQDFNESGIPNVTVRIYADANADGVADNGTSLANVVSSDGTDSNPVGYYQFSGLFPGYYVIAIDDATLPGGVTFTADPDRDGIPVNLPPALPAGDQADSFVLIEIGANYSGADFGYKPTGAVGDFVWLDLNQNGIVDAGEPGLVNVALQITNGVTTYNVSTDFDGYWLGVLADGEWTVTVLPSNFLSGGALSDMLPTYDADGVSTANETTITLAGGVVTTPGSLAEGNYGLDFGYRLDGAYGISGTVVLNDTRVVGIADDIDTLADDGVDLDAGPLDEMELEGQVVYLYTTGGMFLGSTLTDAEGRYAFTGLPSGTYNVILGTTATPLSNATLTTTAANHVAVSVVNNTGTSVIQTVEITDALITQVDFAFLSDVEYDFGDLPAAYGMTSLLADGARHVIPSGGATKWFGTAAPDAESNGIAHPLAEGDDVIGTDDEDGIAPVAIASWADGTVAGNAGGSIDFTIQGNAWLVGWIDWNNDGDFLDAGEFIVNQAVSTGVITIDFDIPVGTITGDSQSWLSRFRLVPAAPAFPLFSYKGEVVDGEVEDFSIEISVGGSIGDIVWNDANGNGVQDNVETGLAGVTVELRDDLNQLIDTQITSDGTQDIDGDGLTDAVGAYRFRGLDAATYTIQIPTPPAGYSLTYDEDGVSTPSVTTVVLASDAQYLTADFGYQGNSSIGDLIWYDADGDGSYDVGETPIANALVFIDTNLNGSWDLNEPYRLTNASGNYTFAGLVAGSYSIVVDASSLPTSLSASYDQDGIGTPNRTTVVLAEATTRTDIDFGYEGTVVLEGHLYIDTDGNGTQDNGEPDLANVDVVITDSLGAVQTVSTDGNGNWSVFVAAGNASADIDETDPDYPAGSSQTEGNDPTITNALVGSVNDGGTDGFYLFASIAGNVFNDANRLEDNTVNGTGTNAGGIFINLVNANDNTVVASLPVNADGSYLFAPANGVQINRSYLLILTPQSVTVGEVLTVSKLPIPWFSMGETLGVAPGNDGTVNGILAVATAIGPIVQANFGIVQAPDLTPVITVLPNVFHGNTDFNIRVQLNELYQRDTEGTITFRIPKDPRWILREAYDGNLAELDGFAMENNKWTFSQNDTHYIFTTVNPEIVIPAGGFSRIGLKARWILEDQEGVFSISSQVEAYSGKEMPVNNNVDAEKIDFFIR